MIGSWEMIEHVWHVVALVQQLLDGGSVALAVIFIACVASLAVPVVRIVGPFVVRVVLVVLTVAGKIVLEKIIEIVIILTVLWSTGGWEIGHALYTILRIVLRQI